MPHHERVFVIDYGGQYAHLISRRCRELGVYSEIMPQETNISSIDLEGVKGIILSGGPRTVSERDLSPQFQRGLQTLRDRGIHLLGICFGHQLLAVALGARLAPGGNREYGPTKIKIVDSSSILSGLEDGQYVWMSHSDEVRELPNGLRALAISGDDRVASLTSSDGMVYGVQFHPEVAHTPNGLTVLRYFLRDICGYTQDWSPEDQIEDIMVRIKREVGQGRVLMATSGGVDSTVAAVLIERAIGDRLCCVFVDNGLLREGERQEVEAAYREIGLKNFVVVDATDEFLKALENIEDPEEKRRAIADTFIRVFERTARDLQNRFGEFAFLGQGTIYPDRVESAATGKATAVIKSHHNVRLPEWMQLKTVEPLRDLYKDEVRRIGRRLGLPERFITRQPFPGPSLAIRMGGPVTRQQLSILRHADSILQQELMKSPIYPSIWQSFCVLLPIRSVGVMGDERTYEQAIVIRMVESVDAMTASVCRPDWELLIRIASRIVNEVRGINRVTYDLTNKPPATIEWY